FRALVLPRARGSRRRRRDHGVRGRVCLGRLRRPHLGRAVSPGEVQPGRPCDPRQFRQGGGAMIVIPAIDLKDGRCVRLVQGRKSDVTVYGDDPVAVALEFERAGAERIHVVDLDGAFDGKPKNWRHLKAVVEAVNVPVQTGGGIRSLQAIEELLEIGVERVILGTVALKAPELVREACRRFGPERVLVGIDARGGRVAVEGWVEESDVPAVRLAEAMREAGVREIVFTDISRDGTLAGPNLASLEEMLSTGM